MFAGILLRAATVSRWHRQVRHQPGTGRHLLVPSRAGVTGRVPAYRWTGRSFSQLLQFIQSFIQSVICCFIDSRDKA